MSVANRIERWVGENPVVLFMKGTRTAPRCGFSASVVSILDGHLDEYVTIDVLADDDVREGIKAFSSWPTIPQLYIGGEFVGGADIVREMDASGELDGLLRGHVQPPPEPTVELSERASRALLGFNEGEGSCVVRLEISPRFDYGMDFDQPRPGDVVRELGDVTLLLDRASARRADGIVIDFIEAEGGGGFKIENPNEPPKVKQIDAAALARMLNDGEIQALYDVRTEEERATANIEGSIFLDQEAGERLEQLPKNTPIAFFCHHGQRSQAAAAHFIGLGFTRVYNLAGGIDVWSKEVDPRVPRY